MREASKVYNDISQRLRDLDIDCAGELMALVDELWDAADSEARVNGLLD